MVGWGETQSLESFLVLSGVDLGNNLFQLPLCLALGEVIHVVVLRGHSEIKIFSVPFYKYINDKKLLYSILTNSVDLSSFP